MSDQPQPQQFAPEIPPQLVAIPQAVWAMVLEWGPKIARVETIVERLEEAGNKADLVHDRCRGEVDDAIAHHARWDGDEHEKLAKRIKDIEDLHTEQGGEKKGKSNVWKILTAILATLVAVLTIITLTAALAA